MDVVFYKIRLYLSPEANKVNSKVQVWELV